MLYRLEPVIDLDATLDRIWSGPDDHVPDDYRVIRRFHVLPMTQRRHLFAGGIFSHLYDMEKDSKLAVELAVSALAERAQLATAIGRGLSALVERLRRIVAKLRADVLTLSRGPWIEGLASIRAPGGCTDVFAPLC